MLQEGMYILAHTKTINDLFGDVVYIIDEIKDGKVKLTMLGGSGPSARSGYKVQDNLVEMKHGLDKKILEILPKEKVELMIKSFNSKGGSGALGMEVDY